PRQRRGWGAKRTPAPRQAAKWGYPEGLRIRRSDATRSLLAAGSVADLVEWSDGLYNPPAKFRSW
ncbi:malonate decarboxylase subunit alpha, partial [Klebsiella pneumoniae]|nr:malonate decarboxylase subunit alpha [Klebsiella pneumoniae]